MKRKHNILKTDTGKAVFRATYIAIHTYVKKKKDLKSIT